MERSVVDESPSARVSCSRAEGLDMEADDGEKMVIVQGLHGNDILKATLEILKRLEGKAELLQKSEEKEEHIKHAEDEDGSTPVDASDAKEGILRELASLRQYLDGVQAHVQTTEASAASLASELSLLSEERNLLQRKNDEMRSQLSELGIETGGDLEALVNHLQEQLSKGEAERRRMRVELDDLRAWKSVDGKSTDEVKLQAVKAETALARLKESFLAVKADKKRLKAEKSDLLQQMKQLYAALQEKEADVKEFVLTYEARMREFEESVHHLQAEKEESEREKWEILRRARDSAERSVSLRTQLDMKESALQTAEDEVTRLKRQLSDVGVRSSPTRSGKGLPNGFATSTPIKRSGDPITPTHGPIPSDSETDGLPPYSDTWRGKSASVSVGSGEYLTNQCPPHLRHYGRVTHRSSEPDLTCGLTDNREFRKSKRRGFGSLSKVFTRPGRLSGKRFDELSDDRSRHSSDQLSVDTSAPSLHGLTDEQLQERWRVLEEAKGQCMSRWRSAAVVAWMEVVLNMPQYARACQENVKSGRVLLGMTDTEVENALGMTNILHRRKLRLAIEAQRSPPQQVRFPKAHEIDHIWVSTVWARQVGLGQHADSLLANLVDGAVLVSLTRKDMEKHIGIVRKFHQASMMYGIELLRRVQFDKQVLAERRAMCEDADTDPLVWTNQRFIKWAHSIDLVEYAENLRDSGVHGGIVVLEPSFGPEAMATALGIPSSRSMIRRHLTEELTQLIKPARAALEVNASSDKGSRKKLVSSLGRSFLNENGDVKRRRSFKDSLGRAFGRRTKHDLEQANSISNISVAAMATATTPTITAASMTLDLESTTV